MFTLLNSPTDENTYGAFSRIYSKVDKNIIQTVFNKSNQILYSYRDVTEIYKKFCKFGQRKTIRIWIKTAGDQIGLKDNFFHSPTYSSSATCISKEGKLFAIHKDHFFKKVKENNAKLINSVTNMLSLIDSRIRNYLDVNKVSNANYAILI